MLINDNIGNGDDETVYRSCINAGGLGDHCLDVDVLGIGGTECFCTSDNCNKDNLCQCNSSSIIGLSMIMLASVFVMLAIKWSVNLLWNKQWIPWNNYWIYETVESLHFISLSNVNTE